MRRLLRNLMDQLSRDDLLQRCFSLLGGATVFGFGGFFSYKTISDFGDDRWSALRIAALIISIALTGWGLLVASRAFVARESRLARLAERAFPDGVGEEVVIFWIVVAAPAILLTFILRLFGVAGQCDKDSTSDR